jgi:hypothetical protein
VARSRNLTPRSPAQSSDLEGRSPERLWLAMAKQSEALKQSQRSGDLDLRLKAADGIDSSACLVAIAAPLILLGCWAALTTHLRVAHLMWVWLFR